MKQDNDVLTKQINTMPDESSDSDEFELNQQQTEEDLDLGNRNEIFRDIEAKEKFYSQAKSEIKGYNKKPNQESAFYHECMKKGLLAQPVFKCVTDNTIKYQGKTMGMGYA